MDHNTDNTDAQQIQANASDTQSDTQSNTQSEPNFNKIDVLLKPAGDAPIMKKKKWSVEQNRNIAWIIEFIRRFLKLEPNESLFLYVNQTFAPSPDQCIKNLYDCFGSDGKLVLYYAKSQAWG